MVSSPYASFGSKLLANKVSIQSSQLQNFVDMAFALSTTSFRKFYIGQLHGAITELTTMDETHRVFVQNRL